MWIDWYLSIPGNQFMVEVKMGYLLDNFNHTGLKEQFGDSEDHFELALDMI